MAKIADVGMSRRMVSDLATAQPIMTPLWSAPEVLRRERVSAKVHCAWGPPVLLGGVYSNAWHAARLPPHGIKEVVVNQLTPLPTCPAILTPHPSTTPSQADMWSYGVLVWEIVTGQDITKFQPLALTRVSEQSVRGEEGRALLTWRITGATCVLPCSAGHAGGAWAVLLCPHIPSSAACAVVLSVHNK